MQTSKLKFSFALIYFLLAHAFIFGTAADGYGSCNCPCGSLCTCGCAYGNECACSYPECQNKFKYGADCAHAYNCGLCGVWLPEGPPVFRPFAADPREVSYSVGWRFDDTLLAKNVIDVSYGDTFALYRWCEVWPYGGVMQLEVEGALWAVFNPLGESAPLINADYYVGVPITYGIGPWSFRLRGFHISSHIGDEFLLQHPHFHRRNPSAEYLDFSISYDWWDELRVYDTIGYIVADDKSFPCKRLYFEAGFELRLRSLGYLDSWNQLYGTPIYAVHYRWNGNFIRHVDLTYILGYEWGKLCGLQRRARVFMEYHDGYSVEGQFSCKPTNYFAIRCSYGY